MPSSNCPNTSVTDLTWYNEHHEKLTLTDEIIDNLSNNNSIPYHIFKYKTPWIFMVLNLFRRGASQWLRTLTAHYIYY